MSGGCRVSGEPDGFWNDTVIYHSIPPLTQKPTSPEREIGRRFLFYNRELRING